jgi:tetratricopeptide (TPR) repeat protein
MGGGDNFLAFLEQELIPELDKTYRTQAFRLLAGHSLGGLLATHAYMKENTLFKAFIAVDPSFGSWDEPTMDKKVAAISSKAFDRSIYWASANSGSGKARNEDRHQRLFDALKAKSTDHFYAKIDYFEDENHSSVPLIAWYKGLLSIFKGYNYPYNNGKGIEELVKNYEEVSTRLSFSFPPPERLVNRIGYRALSSRNEESRPMALDFFKLNARNYPGSYNAFDSLAEAHARLGHKEEAIKNYKKALELNPEYQHAVDQIKKLSEE